MGTCCSKVQILNDCKPCSSCFPSNSLCRYFDKNFKRPRISPQNEPPCSVSVQTEDTVFKLIESGHHGLELRKFEKKHIDSFRNEKRSESTQGRTSQMSLTDRRSASDALINTNFEEVLMIIERLQDICSQVKMNDQLTLICAIGYLRDYCVVLNIKCGQMNLKSARRGSSFASSFNPAADFWVSAYNGRQQEVVGVRKFKMMAMAVKTAIAFSGKRFNSNVEASSIPNLPESETATYLKDKLHSWDFDQFEFDRLTNHHGISTLFKAILSASNLFQEFKIDARVLTEFCIEVEKGYDLNNNPYHNELHGADVLQTTFFIITSTKIAKWLSNLETLAVLFAAMIHDLEHTGTNNAFHQQTASDLALLYNDKSILESHHVSKAYQILNRPGLNPFTQMSDSQFKSMREIVVECVLATDMARHFDQVNTMKNSAIDLSLIERQDLMSTILHCADISGPGKPWEIHERWTQMLMQEFFAQGDKEKELAIPISPLCDRLTTNIPDSQIGFITYITHPVFTAMADSVDVILRDKEERDFLQLSGTRGAQARRGTIFQQAMALSSIALNSPEPISLPPIEDTTMSQESLNCKSPSQRRNSTFIFHNSNKRKSFAYKPIQRIWDKHFIENLTRWEKKKAKEEK